MITSTCLIVIEALVPTRKPVQIGWWKFSRSWFQRQPRLSSLRLDPIQLDAKLYSIQTLDYTSIWIWTTADCEWKKKEKEKKNPVDWRVQIRIAAEPKLRLRYQDTSILLRYFVRKWRKFGPSSVTFLVMWHCSAMWSDCLPFGGFGLHRVRRTFIRITSKSSSLSPHRLIHLYCSLLNESWTSLSIINRWFSNISFDSIGTSAGYCYNENCITEKVQELAAFNEIQYLP